MAPPPKLIGHWTTFFDRWRRQEGGASRPVELKMKGEFRAVSRRDKLSKQRSKASKNEFQSERRSRFSFQGNDVARRKLPLKNVRKTAFDEIGREGDLKRRRRAACRKIDSQRAGRLSRAAEIPGDRRNMFSCENGK
jgi:hypothetical protein